MSFDVAIDRPLPRNSKGYISGMSVYTSGGTSSFITGGQCRDSLDQLDMVMPTGGNLCFVGTDGAGGVDNGVDPSDEWMFLFAIADSAGVNPTTTLMSRSPDAPALPAGYTHFRRVGAIYSLGASLVAGGQMGATGSLQVETLGSARYWTYRYPVSVLSAGAATSFTSVDLSAAIPVEGGSFLAGWVVDLDVRTSGQGVELKNSGGVLERDIVADRQVVVPMKNDRLGTLDYKNAAGGGSTDIAVLGYWDYA